MLRKLTIAAFSLIAWSLPAVAADDLRLYAGEIAPYAYLDNGKGTGVVYEIVHEVAKRAGHTGTIEFLPWARAQQTAQDEKNVAIIPLSRTPPREPLYTWVLHVFDDPFVLVAKKDSKVDISSLEAAKGLAVGVLLGSPGVKILEDAGFTNIQQTKTEDLNARKLKAGRIDAWLVASLVGPFNTKAVGLSWRDLRVGAEVTVLHQSLGGSKVIDPAVIAKWQAALESMKKDGTYDAIIEKYKG